MVGVFPSRALRVVNERLKGNSSVMESSFLEQKQAYHNYLEADFVSAIWVVTWKAAGGLESTTR